MAGPVEQAGELVRCPGCGEEVMLKATIPILEAEPDRMTYRCKRCARALVPDDGQPAGEDGEAADAVPGRDRAGQAPSAG